MHQKLTRRCPLILYIDIPRSTLKHKIQKKSYCFYIQLFSKFEY